MCRCSAQFAHRNATVRQRHALEMHPGFVRALPDASVNARRARKQESRWQVSALRSGRPSAGITVAAEHEQVSRYQPPSGCGCKPQRVDQLLCAWHAHAFQFAPCATRSTVCRARRRSLRCSCRRHDRLARAAAATSCATSGIDRAQTFARSIAHRRQRRGCIPVEAGGVAERQVCRRQAPRQLATTMVPSFIVLLRGSNTARMRSALAGLRRRACCADRRAWCEWRWGDARSRHRP